MTREQRLRHVDALTRTLAALNDNGLTDAQQTYLECIKYDMWEWAKRKGYSRPEHEIDTLKGWRGSDYVHRTHTHPR